MSSHQIQFQHGMSIPEFLSYFGTEAQCAEALPDGHPNSPTCGHRKLPHLN